MAAFEEQLSRIERLVADFEQHMLILQQKTMTITEEIVSIKGAIAVLPTIINVVDVAVDAEAPVASTDAEAPVASTDAEAESSEVIKVLDTLGPDYMQCYLPGDIRDVCSTGKTIALAFSCDMRVRVTTPNDAPEEGTIRRIRNAGINELQIVLCELDVELAVLQPNEIATLVFRDGAWVV